MSVKRYEWVACDEHACHCDVVESTEGDMVDYEDYAALEQRLMESERYGRQTDITIDNLEMQLNAEHEAKMALAAENAALKDEISNITFMRDDDFFGSTQRAQEVMGRLVNVKTPETDAFLAEVRAQGLERLAKAWYAIANETDPGISISESSRLKYRQRADDVADFANEIRQEAAQ
ncbi:hypothetical protein NTH60_002504 [Enterobacter ludwigii]|nr:hypothetical protein [Enterobacter ludwigii]